MVKGVKSGTPTVVAAAGPMATPTWGESFASSQDLLAMIESTPFRPFRAISSGGLRPDAFSSGFPTTDMIVRAVGAESRMRANAVAGHVGGTKNVSIQRGFFLLVSLPGLCRASMMGEGHAVRGSRTARRNGLPLGTMQRCDAHGSEKQGYGIVVSRPSKSSQIKV